MNRDELWDILDKSGGDVLWKDIPRGSMKQHVFYRWKKDWKEQFGPQFDLKGFLGDNKEKIAKALMKKIEEGKSVKSIELALKSLGELIERREDTLTVNINADIIARAFFGVREELISKGYSVTDEPLGAGVGQMQIES